VARKALHGALALGLRQAIVQGLNFVGTIFLARLLSPSEFGVYAVIAFILSFLIAFGDAGLGASLVRQVEEPSRDDYRSIFTVQQMMVVAVVGVFWLAARQVAQAYHLPAEGAWVFRLVALSLLFTSFQVIPWIHLERHLEFDKLAVVEMGMALVYNGSVVALAWKGLGVMSFALGLVARSLTGAILANLVRPWRIGWTWQWERVRQHLRFGIPYQGISVISLLKDSMTPVFIGLLLGTAQVGYLNWASMVAAYPVLALMALQRVYVPAFSRMQTHPESLGRFVERVLGATNGLVAPLAVLSFVLIEPLTRTLFGDKWLVALPLYNLLWLANVFVPTATPLLALLNALGHSRTAFAFAAVWMLATWILGVPLIVLFGTIGFAVANLGVQFTNLLLYRAAQAKLPFRILPSVAPVWALAGLLGLVAYGLERVFPPTRLDSLVGQIGLELVGYALGLIALYPGAVRKAWAWIRSEGWDLAFR